METLQMDMEDNTSLASTDVGPVWQEIFERERAEEAAEGVGVKSELGGDCGGGQGSQSTNLHQPVAPNLALEVTEVKHSNEVEADTTTGDETSMEVEIPQDTLPEKTTRAANISRNCRRQRQGYNSNINSRSSRDHSCPGNWEWWGT